MKKIAIIGLLPLLFLIVWCWDKKTEIINTESLKKYNAESCNKYFEIADCIIEKEIDPSRTDEMREELRKEIAEKQSSRNGLDSETIENNCKTELNSFYEIKDHLIEIWCKVD